MSNKARNTSGKFAAKSETPRKIRSVNLTDDAWQWLADVAVKAGVSRNDYLEAMAEGNIPLMETVNSEASPIMKTVESDSANITEQPDSNASPLMETVQTDLEALKKELEEVKSDRAKLLESSTVVTNKLREEVREVGSQLATERADREEVERQLSDRESEIAEVRSDLSDLKQKSATASQEFPEAADLVNRLRGRLPKSKVTPAEVQTILDILES